MLEQRINEAYEQAKDKQGDSENNIFRIFYLEYPFIVRSLSTLMRKYPLIVPYLLERRIKVPEFTVFKKANVISFFDFLLVGGALTDTTSN